jgi:hypothetical protein
MLVLAHQQVECRAVATLHALDQFVVELGLLGQLGQLHIGHAAPALLQSARHGRAMGQRRIAESFSQSLMGPH